MSTVYCGQCTVRHDTEAPHCALCRMLLVQDGDIAEGIHAACQRQRRAWADLAERAGSCGQCGTYTSAWADETRRICTACGEKNAARALNERFRALEAQGPLDIIDPVHQPQDAGETPATAVSGPENHDTGDPDVLPRS